MIADVESRIQAYMNVCKADNIKPTIYGIANVLGISDETLRHIRLGTYKRANLIQIRHTQTGLYIIRTLKLLNRRYKALKCLVPNTLT